MFGAFIGDIAGSKYEFNNIKTKDFPLFSADCDFTDDSIMTVAVASAILKSREEHFHGGKRSFQEILVSEMQDYGRRYPNPTGAYGGHFAMWLREKDPKPYNSYGNGSAMRVSPCGIAAVNLEEALALARASAAVSHNHPEGIKGAEAVAAAVFLAKAQKTKEEIRAYITEHFYKIDFTLDSIRDSYCFEGSCQYSVPQALEAFFESESFEDAIRNAISIGGDSDTIGAITGSVAWTYYAIQSAGYGNWTMNKIDPDMLALRAQAEVYLPEEFIRIADDLRDAAWRRGGTWFRTGFCTQILTNEEWEQFYDENDRK